MSKLVLVSLLCLGAAACASPQQATGTAAGATAGALVGGPVGAVVGAGVGAAATAPRGAATQVQGAPAGRATVRK
jgi:hypothetical protein